MALAKETILLDLPPVCVPHVNVTLLDLNVNVKDFVEVETAVFLPHFPCI